MRLAEIMREIEEHRFSSEVNLAAGLKGFRRTLRTHPLFRQLVQAVREVDARVALARHVEELADRAVDPRYENRYDAALSAYLTVLSDSAQPETIAKAATAAAKAPNTWWTAGISRDLMAHAVASGLAMPPPVSSQVPQESGAQSVQSQEVLRGSFKNYLMDHLMAASPTVNAGTTLLKAYGTAQVVGQFSKSDNVIVMELPAADGERMVWKARIRRRMARRKAPSAAGIAENRRPKQRMRA